MYRAAMLAAAMLAAASAAAAEPRIVTTSGAITEIVFALGKGESVVAVDTTSFYPRQVLSLPKIGYMRQLSAEGILALAPTVILASSDSGPPPVIEQLRSAGVTLALIKEEHEATGVVPKIRAVATALGDAQAGNRLADDVAAQFDRLAKRVAQTTSRPRVMFVLSAGRGAPLAAGRDTAADGAIRAAGGVNVMDAYSGYKPVSTEMAVGSGPDILVAMQHTVEEAGGPEKFLELPQLANTPAGRNKRLVSMDGSYLLGFGPRAPAALTELAQAFHPDLAAAP
jgi:iron complex transport system substrate-binding protein